MGCATGLVKTLVFVFNLLVALVGLAVLILSSISYSDASDFDSDFAVPSLIGIILGSIIFVIAFLGCCGALTRNNCMLLLYAIILIVLCVLQISTGVYSFLTIKDEKDLKIEITNQLEKRFAKYNSSEVEKEYVDGLQENMKCCGLNGPYYWKGSIPSSCCEKETNQCKMENAYKIGCIEATTDWVLDNANIIGWVYLGLVAVEITAAVFALCLYSSYRNEDRRANYHA